MALSAIVILMFCARRAVARLTRHTLRDTGSTMVLKKGLRHWAENRLTDWIASLVMYLIIEVNPSFFA